MKKRKIRKRHRHKYVSTGNTQFFPDQGTIYRCVKCPKEIIH